MMQLGTCVKSIALAAVDTTTTLAAITIFCTKESIMWLILNYASFGKNWWIDNWNQPITIEIPIPQMLS